MTDQFEELTPEPRGLFDPLIEAISTFFGSVVQYFKLENADIRLAQKQRFNSFRFIAQAPLSITTSIVAAVIGVLLSNDGLDEFFTHWPPSEIFTHAENYTFYAIGLPTAFLLLVSSYIFFTVTYRYLLIFSPDILKRSSKRNPIVAVQGLIVIAQATAFSIVMIGAQFWLLCIASLTFLLASATTSFILRTIDDSLIEIYKAIDGNRFPKRKKRAAFIQSEKIVQQTQRGWLIFNVVFSILFLILACLLFFFEQRDLVEKIMTSDLSGIFLGNTWFIFLAVIIASVAGSFRQNNKFANKRYFSCAIIVNMEHETRHDDQAGATIEEGIENSTFYTIENDPITSPQLEKTEASGRNRLFDMPWAQSTIGLAQATRLYGSAIFSLVVYLVSLDVILSLMTLIALLFSYLLNDLVDYRSGKDGVVHADRALVTGKISEIKAAIALAALVIAFALCLVSWNASLTSGPVALFVVGIAYSIALKPRWALIATPIWCGAIAYVLFDALGESIAVFFGIWLVVLARELVLEFRDRKLDFAFDGSKNLGYLLGEKTWLISAALFLVGGALLAGSGRPLGGALIAMLGLTIIFVVAYVGRSHLDEKSRIKAFALLTHLIWPPVLLYA